MKTITYVHDFCFYKTKNNKVYTAVGLPEEYFNRFFSIGISKVNLITRNKTLTHNEIKHLGFSDIKNSDLTIPIPLSSYFKLFMPSTIIAIVRLIKKSDLIVINFPSLIGLYVWWINLFVGKKYSLEIAADNDQFLNKRFGGIVTFIFKLLFPTIVNKSKGGIYVSNYLKGKYFHKNAVVASNVTINNIVKPVTIDTPLVNNNIINCLFVGGVNKRKGIDIAIESINILVSKGYSNVVLNIAGGHLDNDYMEIVAKLNLNKNVIFHGLLKKDELDCLYKTTDLYLQPSLAEGIPRATLEAMSYGIPIIATYLPGFKEILPDNCLVEPSSPRKLADKIQSLIIDAELCNKLSKMNVRRAEDFLFPRLNKLRTDFYRELIGECSERI